MPELPEVETVRRGLQPVMEQAVIRAVELRRPDLRFPFPEGFAARLAGRRIAALGRRAKYLVADLDDGAHLVMHLGMSGSFRFRTAAEARTLVPATTYHLKEKFAAHDHVVFAFEDGAEVTYNDPRRFGYMTLVEAGGLPAHPLFSGLGLEPTGNALGGAVLAALFAGRRTPLKAALLDQRLIAGLGNIYVCEALFRAALSPLRLAGTLTAAEADALAAAIRAVILDAIAAGGSSLRDYVQADGQLGYFQHSFSVYGREGAPCPRCGAPILRTVQSGRSTFHCAVCQT
ncbi:bifunctional DNA-formamidopyrimidine glycosylase/DNA-(apurinic or apyrimidinic site) lyase [Methylobrevis albus]|uniref:Formamidopyrimidine-DNA glycosylase n=1 Tax=Methylobrevis albus TaxID=2793297 RepID=A0A931I3G1_9HYPH|nr:bifunctional DNA-formamidopyrimidine glycosylase/DNA-(apurinic or apyrimidinic site) lyase [Methylobrevis albus]MBH0238729.1 bifunctional DNA-formamidopyrimidine glycosylase/DNA-(apurinic or apyrimidinic site) lyase [Methylobrevis albus]